MVRFFLIKNTQVLTDYHKMNKIARFRPVYLCYRFQKSQNLLDRKGRSKRAVLLALSNFIYQDRVKVSTLLKESHFFHDLIYKKITYHRNKQLSKGNQEQKDRKISK